MEMVKSIVTSKISIVQFSTLEQWKMREIYYKKATDKMTKAVLHSFFFAGTNLYLQKDNSKTDADKYSRSLNVFEFLSSTFV